MYQRCGRLKQAIRTVEQYLNSDSGTSDQSGVLYLISGELRYETNRLDEAADHMETAIRLCQYQHHAAAQPYGRMFLARIQWAQGKLKAAAGSTSQSLQLIHKADMPPWVNSFVIAWAIRFYLDQGEWESARELVQQRNLPTDGEFTYPNLLEYISLARYLVYRKQYKEAMGLLDRMQKRLTSVDWMTLALETRLVQVGLLNAQGKSEKALTLLGQCLRQAHPSQYIRIFIDEGWPMLRLLEKALTRNIEPVYAKKILNR